MYDEKIVKRNSIIKFQGTFFRKVLKQNIRQTVIKVIPNAIQKRYKWTFINGATEGIPSVKPTTPIVINSIESSIPYILITNYYFSGFPLRPGIHFKQHFFFYFISISFESFSISS